MNDERTNDVRNVLSNAQRARIDNARTIDVDQQTIDATIDRVYGNDVDVHVDTTNERTHATRMRDRDATSIELTTLQLRVLHELCINNASLYCDDDAHDATLLMTNAQRKIDARTFAKLRAARFIRDQNGDDTYRATQRAHDALNARNAKRRHA